MENVEIKAPKAPKDPNKKTQGFYIMRNKDVFGNPQPDGRGIQFIYENDGRMINAAKLIGNITDEEMLDMLKTVEGFRKLVHSIGISIEDEDNPEGYADFVFQMYGKRDTYNSGTTLRKNIKTDGIENIIVLSDFEWSEDDDIPGQIRFEFPKAETLAKVSVKFYLNDGFKAPLPEEESEVDFESKAYKEMISRSLVKKGNNYRIKKALDKARRGEKVTIAFIGGSITQGAGAIPINKKCYAYKTFEGLCEILGKKTDENIHFVKAGVGGTPSELGMIRYDRDVLRDGKVDPDIVVVEFAVNDAGDETNGRCYESLVRKIYKSENEPAVILMFAVFQDDFNLQDRLSPVGENMDIPMVSVKNAVTPQFNLKASEGRVISRNQFFYDSFHPTNLGHRVMTDSLLNLFKLSDEDEYDEKPESLDKFLPAIGAGFEDVHLIDKKDNAFGAVFKEGSFFDTDTELQCVEMDTDLVGTKEFPYNFMHHPGENKPFEMTVMAKSLLIVYKDSASPSFGKALVYVDEEPVKEINPLEIGWTHANAYIILEGKESKLHNIKVQMSEKDEDKLFTILGFGIVK